MEATTLPSPPAKKLKLDVPEASTTIAEASTSSQSVVPQSNPKRKRKFKKLPPPEPGSSEDVILRDVFSLLGESSIKAAEESGLDYTAPIEKGVELELTVSSLSSNGMSIEVLI